MAERIDVLTIDLSCVSTRNSGSMSLYNLGLRRVLELASQNEGPVTNQGVPVVDLADPSRELGVPNCFGLVVCKLPAGVLLTKGVPSNQLAVGCRPVGQRIRITPVERSSAGYWAGSMFTLLNRDKQPTLNRFPLKK